MRYLLRGCCRVNTVAAQLAHSDDHASVRVENGILLTPHTIHEHSRVC
jgi:hypothetical protein